MIRIIDVNYIGGYKLKILFSNGSEGVADLENTLNDHSYEELKNPKEFARFGMWNGSLGWVNGLDLPPDYLFSIIDHQQAA